MQDGFGGGGGLLRNRGCGRLLIEGSANDASPLLPSSDTLGGEGCRGEARLHTPSAVVRTRSSLPLFPLMRTCSAR